ncbi:hypothetical protein BDZ94DRAFT_576795 [Collybia nuda]|uniref:Uncharacterized protein n=1 Tax=Collybia nuda TaxID=64659 RepID=A0A9P5Y8U9_9AGAR|nr:hypothetical protein BDZ94DRAFT_576795 [Collybia nuda]
MSSMFILFLIFLGIVNAFPLGGRDTHVSKPSQVAWGLPACEEPVRTPNASEWTSMEDIARKLPNPLTEVPVYWSGRDNGKSVIHMADRCAEALGAKTIGMLMCEIGGFVMPNTPSAQTGMVGSKLWDYASELFANYTTGRAYVVLGEKYRLNGTFFGVELPTLKRNSNVQSVIQVNRNTCNIECYRYCPNPEDCPGLGPCATPRVTVTEDGDHEGFIYS